jgi:hypothetical protein
MTVQELRLKLANEPDDMNVVILRETQRLVVSFSNLHAQKTAVLLILVNQMKTQVK